MWTLSEPVIVWSTVVIQVVSAISIVGMRRCSDPRWQSSLRQLFLTMLLILGAVTVVAVGTGGGCWMPCGATMSLLTVCATLDLRRKQCEPASF